MIYFRPRADSVDKEDRRVDSRLLARLNEAIFLSSGARADHVWLSLIVVVFTVLLTLS